MDIPTKSTISPMPRLSESHPESEQSTCLNRLCWVGAGVLIATCWLALCHMLPVFSSLMGLLAGVFLAVYVLIWPVDWVERALIWTVSLGYRLELSSDLSSRTPRQLSRLIRSIAIVWVFVVFLSGLSALLIWGTPILLRQIQQLIQEIPTYAQHLENLLLTGLAQWGVLDWEPLQAMLVRNHDEVGTEPTLFLIQPLSDWLTQQGDWVGGALGNSIKNAFDLVTGTLQRAFYVWLAIPLVFFGLMDGPGIRRVAKRLFANSEQSQQDVDFLLGRAHEVMLAFLQGQVMLGFITGVYMFFVYKWFGVKFALLLSVIFFVAEVLPVIGTWIGIIPGLLVAYMSGGLSVAFWVWVCSYSYQTVKDNIVAPKVVGSVMGLHPLVILMAIFLFTKLFGLLGTVFAIPSTAMLYAIWQYILQRSHPIPPEQVIQLAIGTSAPSTPQEGTAQ